MNIWLTAHKEEAVGGAFLLINAEREVDAHPAAKLPPALLSAASAAPLPLFSHMYSSEALSFP